MKATYNDNKPAQRNETVTITLVGKKEEFVQIIDALLAYPIEVVQNLGTYLNKCQKA